MEKTLLIAAMILVCSFCMGQQIFINAAGEFHLAAGYSLPMGSKNTSDGPALLANMKPGLSIDTRYMHRISRNFSAGPWAGAANFSGWSNGEDMLYKGATMSFLSGGGSVMYKAQVSDISRKKVVFFASFSPGISKIHVLTTEESEINGSSSPESLEVRLTRFTIDAQAGFRCLFNQSIGATISIGYQHTTADSQVFVDDSFSFISARAGVFYRMFKDKRYKYSGL